LDPDRRIKRGKSRAWVRGGREPEKKRRRNWGGELWENMEKKIAHAANKTEFSWDSDEKKKRYELSETKEGVSRILNGKGASLGLKREKSGSGKTNRLPDGGAAQKQKKAGKRKISNKGKGVKNQRAKGKR